MTAPVPRPPSVRRLSGLALGAGLVALVPAWAMAGSSPAAPVAPVAAAPTTTVPGGVVYPTTSTNVLVTSPPPTVAPSTTVAALVEGRQWPIDIPEGCNEPALPDVVFVGTVQQTDFRTARFRIDQLRAGSVDALSSQGLIDVRYGIDAKFLDEGRQYLVGASIDPSLGVLASKVAEAAPLFGGDQVIGQTESETDCPDLPDPVRTLLTNGRPVDSGVLRPLAQARGAVARSFLVPALLAAGIIIGLVSFRWFVTGLGWSISRAFVRNRGRSAYEASRRRRMHDPGG